MVEAMTHDEIIKRLKNGEDPIDLAVEKYNRLITMVQDRDSINLDYIFGSRCSLCLVYGCRDDDDDEEVTNLCPLAKIGEWCMDKDSAWMRVRKAIVYFKTEDILLSLINMRDVIKECKK